MLSTKVFVIDGLNKDMFKSFQEMDSDYEDSNMSNKMYEDLKKDLADNEDYSAEDQVEAIKSILLKYSDYSEGDVSAFILGNGCYAKECNINVTCVNYEDIWNENIVVSIAYVTK